MSSGEHVFAPLIEKLGVSEYRKLNPASFVFLWGLLCASSFKDSDGKSIYKRQKENIGVGGRTEQ